MNNLIVQLNEIFGKKAPQLPQGFKAGIVKCAPYLAILGLIIFAATFIPLLFVVLNISAFSAAVGAYTNTGSALLWLIVLLAIEILYLMAIPGLFKRSLSGWNFVFYAQLISILNELLHLNIISAAFSALIGFYILFQVRSFYTGEVMPAATTPPAPMA